MRKRPGIWSIATAVVALVLYVLAVRPEVYELTSPYWLSWHVLLRKVYSIGAFALVAFLYRRARGEWGARGGLVAPCVIATALYSAAIEAGQFATGGREGLGWNAFDIACGALGGALATADLMLRRPRAPAPPPR